MMKLPVSGEAQAQAQPTTKINITKLIKSVCFNIYISHADPPLVRHKTVSPFRRCSGGAELHATLNNLSTPKFKELSEGGRSGCWRGGGAGGSCLCFFVLCCLFVEVGTVNIAHQGGRARTCPMHHLSKSNKFITSPFCQ